MDDATRQARAIMRRLHPDSTEVEAPIAGMRLFDALDVLDGGGEILASVCMMYDEESNVFALIEKATEHSGSEEDIADNLRRLDLLNELEAKIAMLFATCQEVDEAGACWAALSSTASYSAKERIREIGGEPDAVVASLDKYFLTHPEQ